MMKLKLTKKLAEVLDGVDLSKVAEGDVLDVPPRDARLLVAEGWAVRVERGQRRERAEAHDRPRRKRRSPA